VTAPRIVLCGVHDQGLDIVRHLGGQGIPVSCLVTLDQATAERNKASGWVPYDDFARQHDIECYHARSYKLSHADDLAFFRRQAFDLMIFGGWQRLVPAAVLETLVHGCIGQHGSPEFLPRGRGRSPINWSILQGRTRIVWQLFQVTPDIDDGPILDHAMFDITPWDDCRTVYYKVAVVVKQMLARTIPRVLDGSAIALPQTGEPSYYGRRTQDDGRIDWAAPVLAIHNLVRAVTRPYPGAFTTAAGQRVTVWRAQPWDSRIVYPGARLGQIVEVFSPSDHVVNCGDGLLLITDFEGSPPVPGFIYGDTTMTGICEFATGLGGRPTVHETSRH